MTETPLYPVSDPAALGKRVRALRLRQGLKQVDLAGTDFSVAYVSRIESGQRRPDRRVVQALAARLGTNEEFLVTGVERAQAVEARLSLRYAELALNNGEAADASAQLRKLLEEAPTELGDLRTHAEFLLARAMLALGRLDEAAHLLEKLRSLKGLAEPLAVHIALSRCYRESGDLARSIDVAEAGLRLTSELGLPGGDDAVRLTATLATAHFERGDHTYAAHLCQTAIEEAERNRSPASRAAAYSNASSVAAGRGETALAVGLAERAIAALSDSSDERNLARLRLQLGMLLLREPAPDEVVETALRHARRALSGTGSDLVDLCRLDITLATLRLRQGRAAEARELAREVLERVPRDAAIVAADAEILLGRLAWQGEDPVEARRHYQAAAQVLTGVANDRGAAAVWTELAGLAEQAGEVRLALSAYKAVAAAAGSYGSRHSGMESPVPVFSVLPSGA